MSRSRVAGLLSACTGDDPGCFGFLDPDQVIRGVHLIPAFAHGRTDHYMGPSFIHREEDGDTDWRYFYVNMYVFFYFYVLAILTTV